MNHSEISEESKVPLNTFADNEKKGDTQIIIMSDQIDQQKNKEMALNFENQKKDINEDMDTLFDQLKSERANIKIRDKKIDELKQQLKNVEAKEVKRYR